MINRTSPHKSSSLFCDPASITDLPWGARRDAFLTQRLPQRERNWTADRQPGELITSNLPYIRKPIIDFCRLAGTAYSPVFSILPAICKADRSDLDCVQEVVNSGGTVIARFAKRAKAFAPFGLWFSEETAGLKRYVPAEIIFAVWHVEALTPQALAELRELIALSIKAGAPGQ